MFLLRGNIVRPSIYTYNEPEEKNWAAILEETLGRNT